MNGPTLGLFFLGLLVAATIYGWDDIEWLFYSGFALLAIAFLWSKGSLVGVGVARTLDADRVFAGDEVHERIRVRNRSWLPKTWVEISDRSTLPGHAQSRAIAIRSRSESVWVNRTRAERRGRYRLGPMQLQSGDPFGLFGERLSLDRTHELLVYPRLVALPERSRAGGELSGGTRIAPGRTAASPVIRSLRQYAVGDPQNQIAWRASARHGSLLVKELEPDPVSDEWILLDLAPIEGSAMRPATELAVSLAASFALEWLGTGRDVGLLVNRAIPAVVDADAGDRQRLRILETLAVVEPYGEANPAALIGRFAARFSRSTGLLVISTGGGRDMAAPLQHLQRRGVPLMIFVVGNGSEPRWEKVEASGIAVTRLPVSREATGDAPGRSTSTAARRAS